MQTLVSTFNDGLKAVTKIQSETKVVQALYEEKKDQNAKQLEKVNSGIANLQLLTSDLKQSFNDDQN